MATVGGVTPTQIDRKGESPPVELHANGTVTITTQSYRAYSQVAQPRPFTVDNAPAE